MNGEQLAPRVENPASGIAGFEVAASPPAGHRDGRHRVMIESVSPQVDGGRFPIKRIVGDKVVVSARIFVDGHDLLGAAVKHRPEGDVQWQEARDVLLYWARHGVRILRVDNPHTKSFVFWEWVIAEIKAVYPETVFLAEAFTRPAVMYRLAKLGFPQSYTYFTWRNSKAELTAYFSELTRGPVREFFRPSKQNEDGSNLIVVVVNLDSHHVQAGRVELPLAEFGVDTQHTFQAHDLRGAGRYLWSGPRNYVELSPQVCPAQVFRLRRRVRSEAQFEYSL